MADSHTTTIVTRAELVRRAKGWRKHHRIIVFTNGVFDILHRGHLDLLEFARRQGDVLVVGLNNDASTRRLKGPGRPINRQRDRARLLAALKPVDCVCLFGEDTPLNLILALKPDVLVKGSEYASGEIVGARELKCWGGRVKRFRMRAGYSTTETLRQLSKRES